MNPQKLIYPFCLVAALMFSIPVSAEVEKPRLAVISEPSLLKEADLLTVELSKENSIILLEREQISMIIKEFKLKAAGFSEKEAIHLGKVLKAEGLLILNRRKYHNKDVINARLVAVDPSVVLWESLRPSQADLQLWITYIKTSLQPLYSKLNVSQKAAVPISLLKLQCSLRTSQASFLETSINSLLRQRLMHEPQIFVLERWRMEKLVFEKEFSTSDQKFWNGGFLMDGNIEELPKDQILIKARLRSANDQTIQNLEVKGSVNNLFTLIDSLVKKVLTNLKQSPSSRSWDSAEEATRFQSEAFSAENCALYSEAIEAIESACALTDPKSFLQMRTRLYCLEAYPDCNFMYIGDAFSSWRNEEKNSLDMVDVRKETHRLEAAIRGMELFNDFLEKGEQTWNSGQYKNAAQYILCVSRLLRCYHSQDASEENSERLGYLRSLIRKTVPVLFDRMPPKKENPYFHWVSSVYAPYWFETCDETIAYYRKLFLQPLPNKYAGDWGYFLFRDPLNRNGTAIPRTPFLVAWTTAESNLMDKKWKAFLRELASHQDPNIRAFALLIELNQADRTKENAIKERMRAFVVELHQKFESLPEEKEKFRRSNKFISTFQKLIPDAPHLSEFLRPEKEQKPESYNYKPLHVTRFWPTDSKTRGTYKGMRSYRHAWHGENIWFLDTESPNIIKVNPSNFHQEIIPLPIPKVANKETHPISLIDITDRYITGIQSGKLHLQDRKTSIWKTFEIPNLSFSICKVIQDTLYVGFGAGGDARIQGKSNTGILKIDLSDGSHEVIASNQRKPASSPLDDTRSYWITGMWETLEHQALFQTETDRRLEDRGHSTIFSYDPKSKRWEELFKCRIDINSDFATGILFAERWFRDFFYYDLQKKKPIQLLQGQEHRSCSIMREEVIPQWRRTWTNYAELVTFDGQKLYIVASHESRVEKKKWEGFSLEIFEPGIQDPIIIPLRFEIDGKLPSDHSAYEGTISVNELTATKEGLVVTASNFGTFGFWFIPYLDLEKNIAKAKMDQD